MRGHHSELLASGCHKRILLLHGATGCRSLFGLLGVPGSCCCLFGLGCLVHLLAASFLRSQRWSCRLGSGFCSVRSCLSRLLLGPSRSSGGGPQEQEFRDDSARAENFSVVGGFFDKFWGSCVLWVHNRWCGLRASSALVRCRDLS